MVAGDPLTRGREAMRTGAWAEARAAFEEAARTDETPEVVEGLAVAARWLGDASGAIAFSERAYQLNRQLGDVDAAARGAALLALQVVEFRGDLAVAEGWLARARDLLRDRPGSPSMAMVDGIEGEFAGVFQRDFPRARRLLEDALGRARESGDIDGELLASSQLGMILVTSGRVADGMRLLDGSAAAAVSGEISGAGSAVAVCCLLTTACLFVHDFERATEWSRYAMDIAQRGGGGHLFDYPRGDRARLLIWQGRWTEAEEDLGRVIEGAEPWSRPAALARLWLADLRRRQGRFDEAMALVDQVDPATTGLQLVATTVRAAVTLAAGDPGAALNLAENLLRATSSDDEVERALPLETVAAAAGALNDRDLSSSAAEELEKIADDLGTVAIRAVSKRARAAAARAGQDLVMEKRALEEAVALFTSSGAPYETAVTRLELARCLLDLQDPEAAALEAAAALDQLARLGASDSVAVAQRLLAKIAPDGRGRPDLRLTAREVEVLRLVADGRTNAEIAHGTFISVRTVERHVANVYEKIGAHGRNARATATAFAHRNGVV